MFDSHPSLAMSNLRRITPYLEAMALSSIVDEIMLEGAIVTYSNDGSSKNKVGAYVVQSVTINGTQRVLPTFSIITESRESLKELEIATLDILVAACGYKYTAAQILRHIDFVMTDSTSHNLEVIIL